MPVLNCIDKKYKSLGLYSPERIYIQKDEGLVLKVSHIDIQERIKMIQEMRDEKCIKIIEKDPEIKKLKIFSNKKSLN